MVIGVPHIVLATAPIIQADHSIIPLCIVWPKDFAFMASPRLQIVSWHLNTGLCSQTACSALA